MKVSANEENRQGGKIVERVNLNTLKSLLLNL